jgi:hypothetical protein
VNSPPELAALAETLGLPAAGAGARKRSAVGVVSACSGPNSRLARLAEVGASAAAARPPAPPAGRIAMLSERPLSPDGTTPGETAARAAARGRARAWAGALAA